MDVQTGSRGRKRLSDDASGLALYWPGRLSEGKYLHLFVAVAAISIFSPAQPPWRSGSSFTSRPLGTIITSSLRLSPYDPCSVYRFLCVGFGPFTRLAKTQSLFFFPPDSEERWRQFCVQCSGGVMEQEDEQEV